jgi:hypothetical protein
VKNVIYKVFLVFSSTCQVLPNHSLKAKTWVRIPLGPPDICQRLKEVKNLVVIIQHKLREESHSEIASSRKLSGLAMAM